MRAILGEPVRERHLFNSLTKTELGKWEGGLLSDNRNRVNTISGKFDTSETGF